MDYKADRKAVQQEMTEQGVVIDYGRLWVVDYDLLLIVPPSPDRLGVKRGYARRSERLVAVLNGLYRDCLRDQRTVDGAPVVALAGWEDALMALECGEVVWYSAERGKPGRAWMVEWWLSGRPDVKRVLACGVAPASVVADIAAGASRLGRWAVVAARWCAPEEWFE